MAVRYGGLLLIAFGLSAATGSDLRFAASFALFYVLDRKVRTTCVSADYCQIRIFHRRITMEMESKRPNASSAAGMSVLLTPGVFVPQVQLEEKALEGKYAEYDEYKKTAKRFIPYIY